MYANVTVTLSNQKRLLDCTVTLTNQKELLVVSKRTQKQQFGKNLGNRIFDLAAKYDNVDIADLRRLEKLSIKEDKAALDLSFLRNCQSLNVFPKFVCFSLPNVSQLDIPLLYAEGF